MLLAQIERLLNRCIDESTPARACCESLQGRSLSIAVEGVPLAVTLRITTDGARLASGVDANADVRVDAGLFDAMALLDVDSVESLRRGGAQLHGDLRAAEAFGELLRHARPDLEDELARWIGDIPAHALATLARRAARWSVDAREAAELNLAEYLKAEARLVPDPLELARFARSVERTRDDVARLEQRLDRISQAPRVQRSR